MNKCPYDPREMAGTPIGMFHCPECGEMVLAGIEHVDYSEDHYYQEEGEINESKVDI